MRTFGSQYGIRLKEHGADYHDLLRAVHFCDGYKDQHGLLTRVAALIPSWCEDMLYLPGAWVREPAALVRIAQRLMLAAIERVDQDRRTDGKPFALYVEEESDWGTVESRLSVYVKHEANRPHRVNALTVLNAAGPRA